MSLTDAQFKAWQEDPTSLPVLLVETYANIAGVETQMKFSSGPYPDASYLPIMSIGIEYTEQVSVALNPIPSLSYGDLELNNAGHDLDVYLTYVWANRPIVQKLGDVRWPVSDFRIVFNGYLLDIADKDLETLALKIVDRFQQLNNALSDVKLGGSTTNKNVVVPSAFGELHNIAPILIDSTIVGGKYQYHGSAVNGTGEARTDARPRSFTDIIATGSFSLNTAAGTGVVTCSVQGDKFGGTYRKTVSSIIQRIVTGYGKDTDRLTTSDLDLTNLNAFDTANPQTVGYYSTGRENILPICQYLAATVGAQLIPSRTGQLRLIKIEIPPASSGYRVITQSQMFRGGEDLRMDERCPVRPTWLLGFCKNWTVQPTLSTGIPLEHKEMFAKEWLTVKSNNDTVRTNYKQSAEPVQKDTAFQIESEAQAEADRLRDLWKDQHCVYVFTGTAELLDANIGDFVTVVHPRYNMSAGVPGMIVRLKPAFLKREVLVGVLI